MKKYFTHSVSETEALGTAFAEKLSAPTVLCLYGDLGAGKTAFTRGLAQGLGSPDRVSSPTFTLMHEYEGREVLHHFDLYRLESEEELWDIGFEEYLENGISVIEWPNRFENMIPSSAIRIHISYGETENERIIEVENENFSD